MACLLLFLNPMVIRPPFFSLAASLLLGALLGLLASPWSDSLGRSEALESLWPEPPAGIASGWTGPSPDELMPDPHQFRTEGDEIEPLTLVRLADGLKLAGQSRRAKILYLTVLARHPGTEEELRAWMGLGALAEDEARAGAGEREIQAIYRTIVARWNTHPLAAEALFRLGQSYQRVGERGAAAVAYDQLLARSDAAPWRAPAAEALGAIFRSLMEDGKDRDLAALYLRNEPPVISPPRGRRHRISRRRRLCARPGLGDSTARVFEGVLSGDLAGADHERAVFKLGGASLSR